VRFSTRVECCEAQHGCSPVRRVNSTKEHIMGRIRLLGLALLATVALGTVVAGVAPAQEGNVKPGLLFLAGQEGPVAIKGAGGPLVFKSAAASLECSSTETKSDAESEQEKGTHIALIKVHVHLSGCKEGKVSCNSEENGKADSKENVLVLADLHFVDLLVVQGAEDAKLEPGVMYVLLNNHEENPIALKCGVAVVEFRGTIGGLLEVISLTADLTSGTLVLPTALKCDKNDEGCKNVLEAKPFEVSFSGKFEAAQLLAKSSLETSKMVEVDD